MVGMTILINTFTYISIYIHISPCTNMYTYIFVLCIQQDFRRWFIAVVIDLAGRFVGACENSRPQVL